CLVLIIRHFCLFFFSRPVSPRDALSFPTRRSSDLDGDRSGHKTGARPAKLLECRALSPLRIVSWRPTVPAVCARSSVSMNFRSRSEEHTSELQSRENIVCRLLLEKKKKTKHSKARL